MRWLLPAAAVSPVLLRQRLGQRLGHRRYMVGLTVAMQHSLGDGFTERMRSRIVDTLGTSYAELALGPRASSMRQFYQQQAKQ